MALGFDVVLIGVPRFTWKDLEATAWRRDPLWFDGWEIARDPRIRGDGYPLAGLFSAKEVREFHAKFSKRVRGDGSVVPNAIEQCIISDVDDEEGSQLPGKPPPPSVAEMDALLADRKLEWVIIELWDRS